MPKRVLITGASRGIGAAVARRLAEDGWTPLVHYRTNREEAERVAMETNGLLAPRGFDLADEQECRALWEWAVRDGRVDALVNNAGIYEPLDFDEPDEERFTSNFKRIFWTNFRAPLLLSRSFVMQGEGGAVVNVASRVGFKGEAGASAYAAAKAALINLTRSLAVELAPKGYRFFGIAPGWVETAMARPGMEERGPEILAGIPLGRVASPEDCASAVAFLLSPEAEYLSGVVIDINGASYFH
ncbi:MAG: epimerase [Fimbriimonadales bacterium]|nr:MAG: epimerase [Fimbriimonadales bacterium]